MKECPGLLLVGVLELELWDIALWHLLGMPLRWITWFYVVMWFRGRNACPLDYNTYCLHSYTSRLPLGLSLRV